MAQLHQAGYPVPDGFVILPTAFAADLLKPEVWVQVQVQGLPARQRRIVAAYYGLGGQGYAILLLLGKRRLQDHQRGCCRPGSSLLVLSKGN